MMDERDHPCWGCRDFEYYRPIKTTYDRAFTVPLIEVQIPVCSRIVYVLAINRCDKYEPDDFMLEVLESQNEIRDYNWYLNSIPEEQ